MTTPRMPTLFIPHGGGPCFFMEPMAGLPPDTWDKMASFLRGIDAGLGTRPSAILVISGHWQELVPTVNAAPHPSLLFDYDGFPEHTYHLTYPVAGSPALAERVQDLLGAAGIASESDSTRGLDHGVFVPFKLVYPAADVPLVQLSLRSQNDPGAHLALGRALAPLRDEGVLIVGSGMSYHNLRKMFARGAADAESIGFDDWLNAAVAGDPAAREPVLAAWEDAPFARACHPTPEHFLPLLVAAGAAQGEAGVRTYHEQLMGKAISAFRFG